MRKQFLFIGAVCVFLFNTLYAQGPGSAAVPFLLIGPGAKAGGMGETGVALATDPTAIFWNPAGLAFQYEDPEYDTPGAVTFMHTQWLPQFNFDDLFYDYFAMRYYLEEIGMVGFSFTWLNLGKSIRTNELGDELGTFNSQEYAITLSYATKLQSNLSLGVNVKLIRSELSPIGAGTEKEQGFATGGAVDLGVMWEPDYQVLKNNLRVGANLANVGPRLTYIDDDQADPLPTTLRLGAAYKVLDDEFNKIIVTYETARMLVVRHDSTDVDNVLQAVFYSSWVNGSLEDRLNSFSHALGFEYWYGNLIALRTGYFYEHESFGNRKFLTFGAGLVYDIFGFDFGYISDDDNSPLANTMRFSLSMKF
jgi:hypothetical protein